MQKFFKSKMGKMPNDASRLAALAAELRAQRREAPESLKISECGLKVRLIQQGIEAAATYVNPGYVELGVGSAQQAMEAIVGELQPVPQSISCIFVPADMRCDSQTHPGLPVAVQIVAL
jgi:hypothetical protein